MGVRADTVDTFVIPYLSTTSLSLRSCTSFASENSGSGTLRAKVPTYRCREYTGLVLVRKRASSAECQFRGKRSSYNRITVSVTSAASRMYTNGWALSMKIASKSLALP